MIFEDKAFSIDLNDKLEYQRLLAGAPQTHGMRSGRVFLAVGESCGLHSTKDNEELLVFLAGEGQLWVGGEETSKVGNGKICYIPPNTEHNVKNTGSEPLVYIYCVAPAGN
jgi:mannose-6-phosphate isomerase-like protein (cupin superfamily)